MTNGKRPLDISSGHKTYADFEVAVQQKCYICARYWTHFMPESLDLLDYVSCSELHAIQGSGYDGSVVLSVPSPNTEGM